MIEHRSVNASFTPPFVEFLRCWLESHVHEHDRAFIEYVESRRIVATLPERWASGPPQLDARRAM